MTSDFIEEDEDSNPNSIIYIVLIGIALVIFVSMSLIRVDQIYKQQKVDKFNFGVSKATKAYSKRYILNKENYENISEGYLLEEDLDKYGITTNPVLINRPMAQKYFNRILSSMTLIPENTLKTYNIKIINIFTVYSKPNPTAPVVVKYTVEIYDLNNTKLLSTVSNSLQEVQTYVEGSLGVKVDINNSVNQSIHKSQEYDIKNKTGNNKDTFSSYNTFMVIGKNVPVKGRFSNTTVDFNEIQTYSTGR
ncbi:hypothetical protein D3C81_1255520 [compost metagenome]